MSTPTRSRRRVGPVPAQHGAWAFLGLPVATALSLTPLTPVLLLLTGAWVAAYPASYFLLAIVRDRGARHPDPARFIAPLAAWSAAVLVLGIPLLVVRPWLAWIVVLYLAAFAVNIAFARRRDERALVNDLVLIAECTAMVPVTWMVGTGSDTSAPSLMAAPDRLWVLTVAVALVLIGSTLHVKSLIRERADARYRRASSWFAWLSLGAALGLAAWWGLPSGLALLAPFAWFAVRSWALGRRSPGRPSLRPGLLGMIELVGFVLLVLAAFVATGLGAA